MNLQHGQAGKNFLVAFFSFSFSVYIVVVIVIVCLLLFIFLLAGIKYNF